MITKAVLKQEGLTDEQIDYLKNQFLDSTVKLAIDAWVEGLYVVEAKEIENLHDTIVNYLANFNNTKAEAIEDYTLMAVSSIEKVLGSALNDSFLSDDDSSLFDMFDNDGISDMDDNGGGLSDYYSPLQFEERRATSQARLRERLRRLDRERESLARQLQRDIPEVY